MVRQNDPEWRTAAYSLVSGANRPGADLTTTFKNNYPVNAGGGFTVLANSYNDSGDAFRMTLDFSGLAGGALPVGSLLVILDLDINESYQNVTAYQGTTALATNWLVPMGALPPALPGWP